MIKIVHPGMILQIDGQTGLTCQVKVVHENKIVVECFNDYDLLENSVIKIPNEDLSSGQHDDKLKVHQNFVNLCTKYPVDKIGLSKVNDQKVVQETRDFIKAIGADIKIVSKIDSQ